MNMAISCKIFEAAPRAAEKVQLHEWRVSQVSGEQLFDYRCSMENEHDWTLSKGLFKVSF